MRCCSSYIVRVLCKKTYERVNKLSLLITEDMSFSNNKCSLLCNTSSWMWSYHYFEICFCLCVYFFCFHYQRLNIVWMALEQWLFISCGNMSSETPSVSNCNEEGNNFLIAFTVLHFQGQSDKTCVTFHLYFLKWTMIETFIYNTFLEETLLISGF